MIKIYFFLSNLNGGGAQRTVVNILRHINRNIYDPVLVLLDFNKNQVFASEIPEDIQLYNLSKRGRYAVCKIVKLLKFKKPDVIMSTLPQVNAAVALAHFLSNSKSRLFLRETSYRGLSTNKYSFTHLINYYSFHRSDRAVALSQGVANEIKDNYNLSPEKVVTIYNPVDVDRIHKKVSDISKSDKDNRIFKLVACGRLVKLKNYHMLLLALSKLTTANLWELLILGEGPLENNLKSYATELKINDKVCFMGFQMNPYKFMKQADLFLLSSLWEGFGHVIVEAMACGTPVLATDCPYGPKEILGDNEFGWLVPNNNASAFAAKIDYLIDNLQEIKEKSKKAIERANDFDVKVIVAQYEDLFSFGSN